MNQKDFYYGYRQIIEQNETGQPSYTRLPLQPDDFLNPDENDFFENGTRHDNDVTRLYRILENHFKGNLYVTVHRQRKMVWGIPGLAEPIPDIAIYQAGMNAERPHTIIEVVAPRFVEADLTHKLAIYQQADIAEYIIIDAGLREDGPNIPYNVLGYRLQSSIYTPITPDDRQRVYAEQSRLWFAINEDGDGFDVFDPQSDTPISPTLSTDQERVDQVQGEQRGRNLAAVLGFLR